MVGALLIVMQQALAMQQAANAETGFPVADHWSDFIEAKLGEWKPAKSYLVPPGEPHNESKDLIGEWSINGGLDGSILIFRKAKDDTFSVLFKTWGCLGAWKLQRTATLNDGVVTLNKAVRGYFPTTYDRLFFVMQNGVLTLVPAGAVEDAHDLVERLPGLLTKLGVETNPLGAGFSTDFKTWLDLRVYRK